MAKWTDGPEYAPAERPDVFVAPEAPALSVAPPPVSVMDAPGPAPELVPPSAAVPLEAVGPATGPTRDPRQAFDVASTPMTTAWTPIPEAPAPAASAPAAGQPTAPVMGPAGFPMAAPPPPASAWGAAHAPQAAPRPPQPWAPDQPFEQPSAPAPWNVAPPPAAYPAPQLNRSTFPQPGTPEWFAPGPGVTPPPNRLVTWRETWNAATPGMLAALIVGGLVSILAVPLLFVAHGLSARVRYRRRAMKLVFFAAEASALAFGTMAHFATYSYFDVGLWWDAVSGWASINSWVVILISLWMMWDAQRRNERPEA